MSHALAADSLPLSPQGRKSNGQAFCANESFHFSGLNAQEYNFWVVCLIFRKLTPFKDLRSFESTSSV